MAKERAVPGVIRKRGWSDDSDTDREMEVASQVYTRDVERMNEAKKTKNVAALRDVERINEAKRSETVAALQKTKYGPKHPPQIHSVVCTCFSTGIAGREAVQRFPLPNRLCCLRAVWYTLPRHSPGAGNR